MRSLSRAVVVAFPLALGLGGEAAADPVPPGTRIRVGTSLEEPGTQGTLVSWTVHEIVVRPDSTSERTLSYKMTPETRVWESRGYHGHGWLGAGLGLLAGAGLAAILLATHADDYEAPPPYIVSFPLAGVFTGALLGSGIKSEKWKEVRER